MRVLNGTGAGGQATDAATGLSKAGFNVAGTGDADSFKYIKSVISYGQGQQAKAELLQTFVGGGAQIKEDLTLRGIDLVLKTGADYAGIRAPAPAAGQPAPSSSTTSSTTAPLPGTPKNQGAAPQAQC